MIIHAISPVQKLEWKISEIILDLIKKTQAKQIISIDGVSSNTKEKDRIFYYNNNKTLQKKLDCSRAF